MSNETIEEQIDLKCPQCGGIEFDLDAPTNAQADATAESAEPSFDEPGDSEPLECASCGKKLTYGELVAANEATIDDRVQQMGADFAADLKKNLEDAIHKMGFKKK